MRLNFRMPHRGVYKKVVPSANVVPDKTPQAKKTRVHKVKGKGEERGTDSCTPTGSDTSFSEEDSD